MDFPELETKRLKLVELKKEHAMDFFAILSLDEVTRHYGMDKLASVEDAEHIIELMQTNYVEKRGCRWGIVLKETGELIGTAGLNALMLKNKRAEIGYEIHPEHWRKGYASEALRGILEYSFTSLGLERMGAVVYPENQASYQLLEKLGFQKEGMLRKYMHQNNKAHDTFVYSLLDTEWFASREYQ
ncbi:GNAT family N-acetyltransferase [Neobacillus sp. PS3-34]|uniref:GNAT family N-acetyltransferase n=1 Tax=Neobacillus sp. PS3-34 TaxID=3070678 RepID=UPI0027E2135E|nr:GNAT family N-acetyltransferase [Neobacillus sp. PS3-34]WML49215.1 GNAT family N-acetyltransferase [Neobacillus sp. PS3-34]